jgi:hypothetical protein
VLDGQDVALLRASVLDESGHLLNQGTNNVTFSIVSGPGDCTIECSIQYSYIIEYNTILNIECKPILSARYNIEYSTQ